MSYRLYSEQKKMKFSILKKKSVVYRMKCNLLQRYVLQSNLFYHTEIIHIKNLEQLNGLTMLTMSVLIPGERSRLWAF